MDGKYKSMHCMEIPFVFNNIQFAENMTGGGKDAYALAHKISTAWIHFAYHGNPNHRGLPKWPSYTEKNGAAMFFDNTCSVQSHHDKLLLEVTKGGPNLW
jgi:para-nitrobenzyl esterase